MFAVCVLAWHWPPSEFERLSLEDLEMWATIARGTRA